MITQSDKRLRLLVNLGKLKAAQKLLYEATIWLPELQEKETEPVTELAHEASFKLGITLAKYEQLCRSPLIDEDKLLT
jgi:hypothetical protein